MPTKPDEVDLSVEEVREVAGYAAECASRALPIFERDVPVGRTPGGTGNEPPAAVEAAHAASQAAAAAFLHP